MNLFASICILALTTSSAIAQSPYCGNGEACSSFKDKANCDCCKISAETTCKDFFDDPEATCNEGFTDVRIGKKPKNYKKKKEHNCGWDPTDTVDGNNAEKFVCDLCTNKHNGYDVGSYYDEKKDESVADIQQCADICDASPDECAGFAYFYPGTLGADCQSHGETKIGSCYFRSHNIIDIDLPKPGVDCYTRKKDKKEKKMKSPKSNKARRTLSRGESRKLMG